ncbi:MAG: transglutaminase [Flavobacterium sp.]|nr:transglutaminase [Flavobacterium sp.]
MAKINEIPVEKIRQRFQLRKPWDSIIIFLLTILITVPIFIIVHQNLIDFNWYFNLDRIFLFVIIVALIQVLLLLLRRIIIILMALYLLFLAYGSLSGEYGFAAVYEDYRSLIYTMADNPHPQDIIVSRLLPFPNKNKILAAVDYDNPQVRNFAIMATTKHFRNFKRYGDYRTTIQCFAAFYEINSRWNYVSDPKGKDYIAKASESVRHLSGDCDDHAILMAACIRAIGGTPRLIHTTGHIYPEMLIGNMNDLETVNYLVKQVLFIKESENKDLHYHIDERGQIWLNLDYTAKFPGGPFMSEEILGALTLQ